MKLEYVVTEAMLLKEYLIHIGLSRAFCRKLKLYGKMQINGNDAKNYFPVKPGDTITLEYSEAENDEIIAVNGNLDIIFEDEYLLIINKPNGLACQPSKRHYTDNLISIVKEHYKKEGITSNIHLVNRLDMATSGLLIIAKSGFVHGEFRKQSIVRKYYAKVSGILQCKKDTINLPIARDNNSSILRKVDKEGKEAITHYQVVSENDQTSIIDINLETGRTHQIRVHFAHLNHPLIGDMLYNPNPASKELYLHCYNLQFKHPITNEVLNITKEPDWL